MKRFFTIAWVLCLLVGCQSPEEIASSVEYKSPTIREMNYDKSQSEDENIQAALNKVEISSKNYQVRKIVEDPNVVLILQPNSPLSQVISNTIDLEKLEALDYDVMQYIEMYKDENKTIIAENMNQDDVLVILAWQTEGIPNSYLLWSNVEGHEENYIIQYNGKGD
ncbi:MAG: hypothetical protein ACRCST_05010 [Turicibacter sp.]